MNLREKVALYENVLHRLHMTGAVAMNPERFGELMGRISAWSYAHRQGNGELSEREQRKRIAAAAEGLK